MKLLIMTALIVASASANCYGQKAGQPKPVYAPAFSATSLTSTSRFIDLVEDMRIAAVMAEREAKEMIGNVKDSRQLKNVNDLLYGLQEELVSWPIKVVAVTDNGIKLESPDWLSIGTIKNTEPWMKKLRRGDMVVLNATIKRIDIRAIDFGKGGRIEKKRCITVYLEDANIAATKK